MHSHLDITQFMKETIAEFLGVSAAQVDENTDIDRFALNSSAVVSLVGSLEDYLDLQLSPALIFEHKTIANTAKYLAKQSAIVGEEAV